MLKTLSSFGKIKHNSFVYLDFIDDKSWFTFLMFDASLILILVDIFKDRFEISFHVLLKNILELC